MILKDRPESDSLLLPPDNLSFSDRLSRLFSGIDNRWRILAVLTLGSGPSDLMKPELVQLAQTFGPSGLAVRLVFIGVEDISQLERELTNWNDEHIVATGDNIHARRFIEADSDCLPCLKLFSPDGSMRICLSGFDTDEGLDSICRILSDEKMTGCVRPQLREKKVNNADSLLSGDYQSREH
ncbi:MAG: hypothetical protein KAJ98_11780 [Spirochaetaceae bacterium]|nr:hypothetical protein [Spirochaetaceae bacterium]